MTSAPSAPGVEGVRSPAGEADRIDSTASAARSLKSVGLLFVVAFVAVLPAMRTAGAWPMAHDITFSMARIDLLAEHLRRGDLFPVWSSSDAYGLGTPSPLYYHKLFLYVAAFLALVGVPLKSCVIGALLIFYVVGMVGLRLTLLRIGTSSVVANLGAIAFGWSSYAFTDWLVRGALAEFAAMMIVPWVLWWAVALFKRDHFGRSIVGILALLYLAHSVVAMFVAIMVGIATTIALLRPRQRGLLVRRAAAAAGLFGGFLLPTLWLNSRFSADYDPSRILPEYLLPKNQIKPFRNYFVDNRYDWATTNFNDYTIRVGWMLWAALGVLVLVCLLRAARRWSGLAHSEPVLERHEVFLVAVLVLFMAMQTRRFAFLYGLPFLNYIQFPWRLLAIVTPVLVVLVVSLAHRLLPRETLVPGCAVLVAATFAASPILAHKTPTFEVSTLSKKHFVIHQNATIGDKAIGWLGEYLPVVEANGQSLLPRDLLALYGEIGGRGSVAEVLNGSCSVRDGGREFESADRSFEVSCPGGAVLALPVSYNRYTDVQFGGRALSYRKVDGDPRIIVDLPPASEGRVDVQLPTLRKVLGLG